MRDRSWKCPRYGSMHDRDENAARNLRDYVISSREGTARIDACGDWTSTAGEKLGSKSGR
ncbi:zinc ribbon domain-containing protein [Pseudothermotoga thermarum]